MGQTVPCSSSPEAAGTQRLPRFLTNLESAWGGMGETIGQCSDSCLMACGNRDVGHGPASVGLYVSPADPPITTEQIVALIGSLSRTARTEGSLEG